MGDDWQTADALAQVDAYIARHAGCTRDGVPQPGQGSTNRIVYLRRDGQILVCKVFCQAERKGREAFAMMHWRHTGLVPRLLDEIGDRMIVMSFVPGEYLWQSRQTDGEAVWLENCRQVGRAMAMLAQVRLTDEQRIAFESQYYPDSPTLGDYLGRILTLGRSIHLRDPDFGDGFWGRSLDFVQSQLPAILAEPRVLYHQDIGNLHVQAGRFMGFFDLEMCRVGTAGMQLGSAVAYTDEGTEVWPPLREGWELGMARPLSEPELRSAAAVHHLLCWRVISRYLSYDGTPGTGYDWAEPADPARYRRSIERVHGALGLGL
jgi:hypothetical protein